jgi:tRNA threonylcarbamoyladenosine biosynthesis protein TsaB
MQRDTIDVQAVGVALGPGSWSGLRVGLSIAKGLALAGNLTLIGVGTLDILAYQHRHPFLPVCPLIRLGRERFAMAQFLYTEYWKRITDYLNITPDELYGYIDDQTLFCGDLDIALQKDIRHNLGDRALFPAPAANLRRPGYLAELAWQRFAGGEQDDLAQLEPFYLGEPVKPGQKEKNDV